MENTLLIAELILTILLIIGIIFSVFKFISKLSDLEKVVMNMEKILGNGGPGGLRKEVQTIKENCAGKMGDLHARVENLERLRDQH